MRLFNGAYAKHEASSLLFSHACASFLPEGSLAREDARNLCFASTPDSGLSGRMVLHEQTVQPVQRSWFTCRRSWNKLMHALNGNTSFVEVSQQKLAARKSKDCVIQEEEQLLPATAKSLPTPEPTNVVPSQVLQRAMVIEDGSEWNAAKTCGDGACALHALWGSPVQQSWNVQICCPHARVRLANELPKQVNAILESSTVAAACEKMLMMLWSDLVLYASRLEPPISTTIEDSFGVAVFWGQCSRNEQSLLRSFAKKKAEEKKLDAQSRRKLLDTSAALFTQSNRTTVMDLCVSLGYVSEDSRAFLGEIREDILYDPLQLFQASEESAEKSRFDALFGADEQVTLSMRAFFFNNTFFNRSNPRKDFLLETLEELGAFTASLANVCKALTGELRAFYDREPLPEYPQELSLQRAWTLARSGWLKSSYWFTFQELLFFVSTSLRWSKSQICCWIFVK